MSDRARPSGRRPGDSGTRQAILDAARRQFAEQGYDRTTMRGIALEAGVDPSLVAHFHGSKQQLFVRVVELPIDPVQVVPAVLAGARETIGLRLAGVIAGVLDSEERRRRVIGLVRAAATEPEAARLVRDLVTRELFAPIAEGLGTDRAQLRASLVGAQVVGMVMARHVLGVEPLASLESRELVEILAPILQRILTEPLWA
jgi:AcrR family transcriptional regulator